MSVRIAVADGDRHGGCERREHLRADRHRALGRASLSA